MNVQWIQDFLPTDLLPQVMAHFCINLPDEYLYLALGGWP